MKTLLIIFMLIFITSCGSSSDNDSLEGNSENTSETLQNEQENFNETNVEEEESQEDGEENVNNETPTQASTFLTGRTFRPDSSSGFKCQSAETRGGQTVCLLPYQYTLEPYYTKTDHAGHMFSCNSNGDTFNQFTLISNGEEYEMFFEDINPFGGDSGRNDYFCANFVGTASGNIGRTHVRLTKQWSDFNGRSVSIEVCKNRVCDTLILR